MKEKEILAIWDDHDFGLNDGGKDYPNKEKAKKMFLNFWNVVEMIQEILEKACILKKVKNIDGAEIEIIALDTRYFRSKLNGKKNAYKPNTNPHATILGEKQWDWSQSSITNSTAKAIIILSSIQILATDHPYENGQTFH